jgi:hypothetical protein
VVKEADTSDPGDPATCTYGDGNDVAKPCNTAPGGAGMDTKGKIVRTIGNGAFDASGIHFRFVTPQLSTTWSADGQGCPTNATFDGGAETILSQIILQAEPTTAGARAQYVDMNSDGCSMAGAGFSGPGPIDASPAASPASYGGGNSTTVAVGFALSGSFPLFDIGFVAVTPNGPATIVASQTCNCTPVVGCPE